VQVPKSALLRPHEAVRIAESEAYNPDEMVDSRLQKANEKDFTSSASWARSPGRKALRAGQGVLPEAAASVDPKSKEKEEMDEILARNEGLIKEGRPLRCSRR